MPARSLARYSAVLATSSSVPIRCIGRNDLMKFRKSALTSLAKIPAPSIAVGKIELTATPREPSSLARISTRNCGGGLARAVQPVSRHREGGITRADVDDPSIVDDMPGRPLQSEERSLGIDCEQPIEVFLGDVQYGLVDQFNARVRDNDVEATEFVQRRRKEAIDLGKLRHIRLHRDGSAARSVRSPQPRLAPSSRRRRS